jgi:hypothetical protein
MARAHVGVVVPLNCTPRGVQVAARVVEPGICAGRHSRSAFGADLPLIGRSANAQNCPTRDIQIAVGTPITGRPPHRTVRAAFPHTAPTSDV